MIARRSLLGGVAALAAAPAWARLVRVPPASRELMVPVTGGRVFVRITGDLGSSRAPLIAINGGPGVPHSGLIEMLALADERAVILYDQLDTGRADHPGDPANWTVPRFVSEIDAIQTVLSIPRWHVFGQSWGGTLALEYGARRPAGLASLILASPLVSTRTWIADTDALRRDLPADTQQSLTACEAPGPPAPESCRTATAAFNSAFLQREEPSPARVDYEKATRAAGARPFNQQLYETMWGTSEFSATGTLKSYDGEPLLASLDGPRTLFVGGQYDEARPATLIGFSRRVPGSEVAIIPGAGHAIDNDRPDETVAVVRAWLARKDAG